MNNIQLISTNSELKNALKKEYHHQEHFFAYSTLKDGLRNLSKTPIDVLIVEISNSRLARGLWMKRLNEQKDLAGGEMALLLITPAHYQENSSFLTMVDRYNVQDIYWYRGSTSLADEVTALSFFLKKNLQEQHTRRSNILLAHENQSLISSLSYEGNNYKAKITAPAEGPPWSFLNINSSITNNFMKQVESCITLDRAKLLIGKPGLEQEQLALFMHMKKSAGKKKPFISIDLKKIPLHLQEARLFGYKKDTLPSALRAGKGAIEQAHSGTLYISDIDQLEWNLQAKLLDCLGSGEYSRIGERKKNKLRCQVILSAPPVLEKRVEQSNFRQDLFYHLNIAPIHIPGVGQRREDIITIVENYCHWYNIQFAANFSLSAELKVKLSNLDWPGEIDEIYDFLSRFFSLASSDQLGCDSLANFEKHLLALQRKSQLETMPVQLFLRENRAPGQPNLFNELPPGSVIEPTLQELEKEYIKQILTNHNGNYSKAARILGITRKTLYDKVKKYSLLHDKDLKKAE